MKNKWVFVWMGEPAQADERLLPDNFSNDHPEWRNLPGYLHYDTPYLLICDNLLDFSHLSYVHEKTLGGSTAIAQARPTIDKIAARSARVALRARRAARRPTTSRSAVRVRTSTAGSSTTSCSPGTLLMRSGGRQRGRSEDDIRPTRCGCTAARR